MDFWPGISVAEGRIVGKTTDCRKPLINAEKDHVKLFSKRIAYQI
jgi:hypothetical protein